MELMGADMRRWAELGKDDSVWLSRLVKRAIRSAWTACEIESPLPSASAKRHQDNDHKTQRCMVLTRIAGLANLAAAPVKVVALSAYPIARLLFGGTLVAGIHDRRILCQ
jgi:hypothetical protein